MFGADVGVVQGLRLLGGESEDFFHPRRVGDVAGDLGVWSGADLFLYLHADGLQIEAHFLKNIDGHALS